MTRHDCEAMRDLLPLAAGGRLDGARLRSLADHLRGCAACEEELALLRGVGGGVPATPPGLETRIAAAVRAAPSARGLRHRFGGFAPLPLAAAATLAVALGGAALYERMGGGSADPDTFAVDATLVWAGGADDPLVQGGATLAELTDEELETLLMELEL